MAELTEATTEQTSAAACCSNETQADCCEPADKEECCTPRSSSCGCSAGSLDAEEVREAVRSRYAASRFTKRDFETALAAAGLEEIEIEETHRVHSKAASAMIRARKPALGV